MSRVGNKPIPIPPGVKVGQERNTILVEGPKGKLSKELPPLVSVKIEKENIIVARDNEMRKTRMMHGLARSLIAGMVIGVVDGYKKNLEIVGVGYKAQIAGENITLNLGFSHPIVYHIPKEIKITITDNTKLAIEGIDKQLVGEVAATVRRFRKPEPYKGKGVRYAGEHITMKEGKTVA